MILSTHALAGAATALLLQDNFFVAGVGAVASHYLLDAMPHWDYLPYIRRETRERGKPFGNPVLKDLLRSGVDCIVGLTLALSVVSLASPELIPLAFLGVIGGVFPDFLQLLFHLFPNSSLVHLQRFHKKVHTKKLLFRHSLIRGFLSQIVVIEILLAVLISLA